MITLETLEKATKQQVFDQVATHLLTQMKQCKSKDMDTCVYKNTQGLKCAAGCLISDEEYEKRKISKNNSSAWRDLISQGLAPEKHASLIVRLQQTHDDINPLDWRFVLEEIAVEYRLNQKALKKFKIAK